MLTCNALFPDIIIETQYEDGVVAIKDDHVAFEDTDAGSGKIQMGFQMPQTQPYKINLFNQAHR